jgi:transcriptional regulator with XRE-family HTH domain
MKGRNNMPEFAPTDLKAARVRSKKLQYAVAADCGVSERTIQRWESGELQPEPDDVDRYAVAVGDPALWHRWMLSHFDSYRRRYIGGVAFDSLAAAMSKLRFEMADVSQMYSSAERDGLDGAIDDPQLKTAFTKELKDLVSAASALLQKVAG